VHQIQNENYDYSRVSNDNFHRAYVVYEHMENYKNSLLM
ncbi:uncharacterized protein METZ01_LOCUS346963, partial [marine metagenome]